MHALRLFLLFALLVAGLVIGYRFNVDLVTLHHKATLLHHDLTHLYDFNEGPGPYFYGPISLVMIYPLGALSYDATKIIWLLAQALAYFVFWRNLARLYPFLESRFLPWLVVWIVAINGIHNNFQSNNIGLMLAAALFAAEYHARRGRFIGGFLCALAACVKVFPIYIAIYYLVGKRARAVKLGVIGGFVASLVLPFALFGFSSGWLLFQGFVRSLTQYTTANPWATHEILCLPSLVHRIVPEQWAGLVTMGIAIPVSIAFWATARKRDSLGLWALGLALMTVLNPSTRPHYFVFLVPAFCSVLEVLAADMTRKSLLVGTVLTTLLISFTTEGVVGKNLNNQLEDWNVPTIGILQLCVTLAAVVWRRSQSATVTASNPSPQRYFP